MSARWTVEPMACSPSWRKILRDGKIVAMDVDPRAAEFLVAAANLVEDMEGVPCLDNPYSSGCGWCLTCRARSIKAIDAPEYQEGREQ